MTDKKQDPRSRDWLLTFPYEVFTESELREKLEPYNYIGQQEISDGEYHHYHIYIQSENQVKFSTLKNKFPKTRIEKKKGSSQQLYNYVTKRRTQVPNTTISKGEMKLSNQGALRMSFEDLRKEIEGGMRLDDLILSEPITGANLNALREYEQALVKKRASTKKRDVEVNYLFGESGVGKTHYVYDKYGFENIYRVSNYKNPFDTYNCQKVLVLDEFYESLDFGYLLNVLDGWPMQLSARYYDRWAEYDVIWIISNRRLENQYTMQKEYDETQYAPFLRRIKNSYVKTRTGFFTSNEYLDSYFPPEMR